MSSYTTEEIEGINGYWKSVDALVVTAAVAHAKRLIADEVATEATHARIAAEATHAALVAALEERRRKALSKPSVYAQDKMSAVEWDPAAEMLDARALLTGRVLQLDDPQFVMWIKSQCTLDEDQIAVLLQEKAILAARPVSSLRTDTDSLTYDAILDGIIRERDRQLDEDAIRERKEVEEMAAEGPPTCDECGEISWWCKACNDPGSMWRD